MTKKFRKEINYYRSIKHHLLRQSNICSLCGKKFENIKDVTIDHITPLSKGGSDNLKNLQLAHQKCNNLKGNNV